MISLEHRREHVNNNVLLRVFMEFLVGKVFMELFLAMGCWPIGTL